VSDVDSVTVLTTKGPLATKRITRLPGAARPVIEAYCKAAHFSISEAPVSGIDTLAAVLNSVELRPTSFLVRGKPAEGIDRWSARRRLHARKAKDGTVEPATLEPVARHWIPLDLDSIACPDSLDPVHEPDRAVEHVVALLPGEFHGATFWWAFTSGQGVKDGIRIRLFYWADRPLADWELKQWLGDSPVDPSIFAPTQPIYVAKPLFVGMPDPVPIRSGIWRGDRDEITPPIIEKPKVRNAASGQPFFAEPGGSYEYHRSHIGDHDSGSGFFAPIKSAVASWIARQGSAADTEWLRADLERAIHEAPRDPAKHPDDYVDLRVRDLEPLIAAILALEVAAEAERRQASECEPSYPAPLGSVAEARERLAQMFDEHVRRPSPTQPRVPDIARSWSGGTSKRARPHEAGAVLDFDAHGPPAPPACPVQAISVDVGLGKTRTWRERVAPAPVGGAFPCILAVPRHRLGDEIVHDLAETGITARVFRGREAADPEQPGENMCRELARVTLIADALGVVSRQACKHKGSVCESYDVCGYQRQRQGEPDVWIVPHQLLFRVRPSFIPEPASLVIDESFWSGALHGIDVPVKLWVADLREVREIEGPGGEYYTSSTADLMAISHRVCSAIEGEEDGRIRQGALTRASLTAADCRDALRLEWQRKLDIEVEPTTPLAVVKALCRRITAHNQLVARLARFWGLLARTIETPCKRSPWIAFQKAEPLPGAKGNAPAIRMIWRDDIHESWGRCDAGHGRDPACADCPPVLPENARATRGRGSDATHACPPDHRSRDDGRDADPDRRRERAHECNSPRQRRAGPALCRGSRRKPAPWQGARGVPARA